MCAGRRASWGAVLLCFLLSLVGFPRAASAERRLYILRVALANGERYDTLSSNDPYTYASGIGVAFRPSRDYRVMRSRQADVRVVASWIERREPLRDHWTAILREQKFYESHNHRPLPKQTK